MLCFHLLSRFLVLTILFIALAFPYHITINFEDIDAPIPGDILFFTITLDIGDQLLVDVLLLDESRGNTTLVSSTVNARVNSTLPFAIPVVPHGERYALRLVAAFTGNFLADSMAFPIFMCPNSVPPPLCSSEFRRDTASDQPVIVAIDSKRSANTAPTVATVTLLPSSTSAATTTVAPTTTLPPSSSATSSAVTTTLSRSGTGTLLTAISSLSTTSVSPSSSITAPVPSSTARSNSRPHPVGTITGGVLGGIAFILFSLILYLRLRSKTNRQPKSDKQKTVAVKLEQPHSGYVHPYTLEPRHVEFPGPSTSSNPELPHAGISEYKSEVKNNNQRAQAVNTSSRSRTSSFPVPPSDNLESSRAQLRHLEQERINQEIIQSTNSSGSAQTVSSVANSPGTGTPNQDQDIAGQLAVLRDQVRHMEVRQAMGASGHLSEPPPGYEH